MPATFCVLLSDHNINSSCLMAQFSLNVLTWSRIAFLECCHSECIHAHININTHENESLVSQQEVETFILKHVSATVILYTRGFDMTLHTHFIETL